MIPRLPKGFSHPMTIGEGSFSSVYRVRQNILDRWVAVKILHEKNGARRLELLNEARNQAQMSISCIPSVYDAFSRGEQVFIVMEWIKGSSLLSLLERGIPHHADRAALAGSIIAALAGLHKLGFAHRDFKPANILVSPEADVYLVDFGFSKRIGEGGQSMIGMVKGTPAYMAPEAWRGGVNVDFMKADLFALGRVLQELALGPEWKGFIQPLLSIDPADRPVSAGELWDGCQSLGTSLVTPDSKALIDRVSSELLSHRLLQAAKQLLFAKRNEEAYWLLAECLQEDPDAAEALRLIDAFPGISRVRKRKRWMATTSASLAFVLALLLAFHFGKRSEMESRHQATGPDGEAKLLLLPSLPGGRQSVPTAAKFREFTPRGGRLAGLLFVEDPEDCDSLFLDAQSLFVPLPPQGLPVESGEHSLVCLDRKSEVTYREKLALLPFQRKIVRLHKKIAKKEA